MHMVAELVQNKYLLSLIKSWPLSRQGENASSPLLPLYLQK